MESVVNVPEKIDVLYHSIEHIVNDEISNSDYASSPLIAYVNDSLASLAQYLDFVLSLKKD